MTTVNSNAPHPADAITPAVFAHRQLAAPVNLTISVGIHRMTRNTPASHQKWVNYICNCNSSVSVTKAALSREHTR